eukprot:1187771-Prorocentrum_minimum.AAC.1
MSGFLPAQVGGTFQKSKFLTERRESVVSEEDSNRKDDAELLPFLPSNDPDELLEIYAAGHPDEDEEETEVREAVQGVTKLFLQANRGKILTFLTEEGKPHEVPIEKFCQLATDGHPRPWAALGNHAFEWAKNRAFVLTRNADDEYAALGLAPLLAKYNTREPIIKPEPEPEARPPSPDAFTLSPASTRPSTPTPPPSPPP